MLGLSSSGPRVYLYLSVHDRHVVPIALPYPYSELASYSAFHLVLRPLAYVLISIPLRNCTRL